MPEQPIRFGILGAARIAPAAVVAPARRVEGVRVDAVAARDGTRAQAFARSHAIPRWHAGYAAILDDPDLDAIYIALPNAAHAEWALRALAAGKHVLCEKPLASNAKQAEQIAEAAARPNAPLFMEAFHNHYHPLVQRACAVALSGELGDLEQIDVVLRTPMLRREDIRFEYALGGGATMDLGCYGVRLLRAVTGEEPAVEHAEATLIRPDVDRRMRARLRLPSGGVARLDVELQARRFFDMRLVVRGTRGTLAVVNPLLPHLFSRFRVQTAAGVRRERFARTSTYECQMRAFAAAVRSGVGVPTSAGDGVLTMRVIDDLYRAAGLPLRGG